MEQKRFPIFAERLTALRDNMTQAEFADFLGVSRATLGFYESGTRVPDILTLRRISEKCNVPSDWLLGITDVKNYDMTLQAICNYTGLAPDVIQVLHDVSRNPENDCALKMVETVIRRAIYQYSDLAQIAAHFGRPNGKTTTGRIGIVTFAGENIHEWFERFKNDPHSSSLSDSYQAKLFHTLALQTVQDAVEYALKEYEEQFAANSEESQKEP